MLDKDTISRLNKIKRHCFPDRPTVQEPQIMLSIESQLNELLHGFRKRKRSLEQLKKKYNVKPRNNGLYQLVKQLTHSGYQNDRRIIPL